jgi:ACS family tartrate transporter-like MFS transporter
MAEFYENNFAIAKETNGATLEIRTLRRISWRLLPLLMLCYFAAYLDRVNVSFAALQMNRDLDLNATAYGLGAGLFFVTYCLFEVPSNLLLYRFGAPRWIARIMLTWGLAAAAMAFIHTRGAFYTVRLLLGAAEAGFYPGIIFYITTWFPARHRGLVLGLFLTAIPVSGIIGAPLSGYLLSLDGLHGLRGWRWLYLVEALPALLLAPVVLRLLPAAPENARWLSDSQREWLVAELASERDRLESVRVFSVRQALTDPRVLLLAAVYFTNVCLLNGITFFLPQIVSGLGLSPLQTGFVVAVPNVLALLALLWWGRRSDRRSNRYTDAALPNMAGGALLLAAVLVHDPRLQVAAIAGAFACTLAFASPFWAIPGTFLSRAAAAGGIAAISSLGVIGGFLAPWIVGLIRDATGNFRLGLGAIAILTLLVTTLCAPWPVRTNRPS